MIGERRRGVALLLAIVAARSVGCGGAKAAPIALSTPSAAQSAQPVASAPGAPPQAYEQPKGCAPPLTWEDGSPIASSDVCPHQPEFFLYEGSCCRYQNVCVAPQNVPSYPTLERCDLARTELEERSKQAPLCQPQELRWEPRFCVFASCKEGQFVTPQRDYTDCERPIGLKLRFQLDQKTLSSSQIGQIENLAKSAEVLGVKQFRVEGGQSYDEKPDEKSKAAVSLQRANAVKVVLAKAARIPITVHDAGTTSRSKGSPDLFRTVTVSVSPLAYDSAAAQPAPFTMPWKVCESSVTFRTEIAITKHDGVIVVEVCRDDVCSRSVLDSSYHAAWPVTTTEEMMKGALDALLWLEPTRQQSIRNQLSVNNRGVFAKLDGEKPAYFRLKVSFEDPAISEGSTYSLRLLRHRTDVALDWSGKLAFVKTLRHPTRDSAPCLQGELEIPMAQHELH